MVLTLASKQPVAGRVWAYEFTPPAPLTWQAGQFVRLELTHENPDAKGTKRFYTIAAAPHEATIRIVTRLAGSTFKQALDRLQPGETIKLVDPPAGDFVWQDTPRRRIFVAQGVGLTPFYAILKDRLAQDQPIPVHLIYAHHPDEVLFADELARWQRHHPEFTASYLAPPITPAGLAAAVPELNQALVYVCGPKALVPLLAPPYNVPATQLKHDRFSGYAAIDY